MANDLATLSAASASLVERARLGDQNAMGMLTRVKEQASKGVPRAKLAFEHLMSYIRKNPAKGHGYVPTRRRMGPNFYNLIRQASQQTDPARFSADVATLAMKAPDSNAAAVALADGQLLTRERLQAIARLLGEEKEQKLFFYCCHCNDGRRIRMVIQVLPPHGKQIVKAGRIIGHARKIQGIRSGNMPLARLSPMVAWELGE